MNKQETGYFLVIAVLMVVFLFGVSFFNGSIDENDLTGNLVLQKDVVKSVETQPKGEYCEINCLKNGCFTSANIYLGYNINICKCQTCTGSSDKSFYCHANTPIDKDLVCEWQRT